VVLDRLRTDEERGRSFPGRPNLPRLLAASDVALVQGGLTTTMELVALGRPFVAFPLRNHFEQRLHVRHRLDRYGARWWLVAALAEPPAYRPVATDGAARAAALMAELL
jgi:UDP-N-acetylglucosamine:LPS N-acetylglucosamine transferase